MECELCEARARMYCESDKARLCWDCDAKVHGANFIVARHARSLLCGVCQAPTPWKASGRSLGYAASICHRCARKCGRGGSGVSGGGVDERAIDDFDGDDGDEEMDERSGEDQEGCDDDYDSDVDCEDEDEDGENQVVPWGSGTSTPPPPPPVDSSSRVVMIGVEEICLGGLRGIQLCGSLALKFRKKTYYLFDNGKDDEVGCSYGHSGSEDLKTAKESIVNNSQIRPNRGGFGGSSADHHFPKNHR
ncbi:hypothetical protein Syun_027184 [Stephania yunnanensis]|uniref:B box-type domain-containing protein n=1 Tax=Stephania yunnanensis TaxID=152371 RepID=A0AAP0EMH8_9MAGN